MKITDKMRLDWAQKNASSITFCHGAHAQVYTGIQYTRGDTLRQAIDAAIRAGERNKI